MVRIEDEWLLAVGSVALAGSLWFTAIPRLYVAVAVVVILVLDVMFLLTRDG